jgi:hypothetical protein
MQKDRANAVEQENVRGLEDRNEKLSATRIRSHIWQITKVDCETQTEENSRGIVPKLMSRKM